MVKPKAPKRLVVTLPPEEHAWLAKQSYERDESMAEVVREAVAEYRSQNEKQEKVKALLEATFGIRKSSEDALETVRKLRAEWDR